MHHHAQLKQSSVTSISQYRLVDERQGMDVYLKTYGEENLAGGQWGGGKEF